MAFFIFVIKSALLEKTFIKYKEEKELNVTGLEGDSLILEKNVPKKRIFSKFQKTALCKYLMKFKRKNTKENICIKSITGFIGGLILTYVYFFFFVFGLRFPLGTSTYVCGLFGIIFCLGLAFSRKIRCYILLMIPVFFSKEGRQVMMTYALFLTFTGPVKNTIQNIGILSDSMTCGQEVIKRTLKQIEDAVKAPFRAMKSTIDNIIKSLKESLDKMKEFLSNIKRIILGILHVIKKAVSWLGTIINFCNKKVGTPFQRCMKTFNDAIEDCKAKMGILDFLCHVVHAIKALCYTVKFLDLICLFTEFVSDSIVGVVKRKLREFGLQVKNMFYVSIEFTHSYDYKMESTNSTKIIAQTVFKELLEKAEKFDKFLSALGWGLSFVFIFIFFRVYYYKYKYMSSDRFDNRYITKYFAELDMKRIKMNKETVLPLERREKKHFCHPTSIRLLREEQKGVLKALMLLSLSTFEILSLIVCDYCLYWVLFIIYTEGSREIAEVQAGQVELYVSGKGSIAEFYRKLGRALKVPDNPDLHLDPIHCLPDPVPPDKDRYIQIGCLIGLCWVLTVTEAYGLRLRTIVMAHYYPARAKERSVWLYNHILRSRGSFMKFARRQLRRKLQGGAAGPIEKISLMERILATVPLLAAIFGRKKEDACLICGIKSTDEAPLKRCKTFDCPGKYCLKCYATLGNVCTICQHPIEYGDISDISEERDSSEEELYDQKPEQKKIISNDSDRDEKWITFREMETRAKFRDLERNEYEDFARKLDFNPDRKSDGEDSLEYRGPPDKTETYELVKEKASSLILRLKKQRAEKSELDREKEIKLIRVLKQRLEKAKSRRSIQASESELNQDMNYIGDLRKAKMLTESLKKRKAKRGDQRSLLNILDYNEKEQKPDELDNIDYGKFKDIVKAKMRKMSREKEESGKNEFNREKRPYSGFFSKSENQDSIIDLVQQQKFESNPDVHFNVQLAQFLPSLSTFDFPKENQKFLNLYKSENPFHQIDRDIHSRCSKHHDRKDKIARIRRKLRKYVKGEIEKQLVYFR